MYKHKFKTIYPLQVDISFPKNTSGNLFLMLSGAIWKGTLHLSGWDKGVKFLTTWTKNHGFSKTEKYLYSFEG